MQQDSFRSDDSGAPRTGRRIVVAAALVATWLVVSSAVSVFAAKQDAGKLRFDRAVGARFAFDSVIGERLEANVDNWLLRAPQANPGMIEMFRLRDRKPVPSLVPWAGEFVGKFLISAVQARRMTERKDLDAMIRGLIAELISTQADDGYLGPFRKQERLLKHWDLWGHYHCMLALMMWHEDAGDGDALRCARRAADLVCKTFLDTERRVFDAGSHEMNMSIIHALGWLHRRTGEDRYFRMMSQIEKDWERAGDYFRTGLAGVEFFRIPKPRWESLHCVQGLVELYRITGRDDYRKAYTNLWTSIAHNDRHNTGGFSTGEQAIGDPYQPGAIETCCTTAWMALTVDALRLTGDSIAADELEWSTFNSVLGSQHPSGRWWTYNTPMDGMREASADTIVFQARVGTPELNCCSVNAPRGLGMLSEWAVMLDDAGPILNFYGPSNVSLKLRDGTALGIKQETAYSKRGDVKITLTPDAEKKFTFRLRIPFWSKKTAAKVNGTPIAAPKAGTYLSIDRTWKPGDVVDLSLDFSLRVWPGEGAAAGHASIYYGPLLLVFDQHFNEYDTDQIPSLDIKNLRHTPTKTTYPCRFEPIVLFRFPSADGKDVILCDFATAGAHGTHYRSWLPAKNTGPAPFYLRVPKEAARIPAGPFLFEWGGARAAVASMRSYELIIAKSENLADPVVHEKSIIRPWYILRKKLQPGQSYYWKVVSKNPHEARDNEGGVARFTVDASLPNEFAAIADLYQWGKDDLITASDLDGRADPRFGKLESAAHVTPAADRRGQADKALSFNGKDSKVLYRIAFFPEGDYTFHAWVRPQGLPTKGLEQIFSAWARGMDDPLRVTLEGDDLTARIEAGRAYATKPVNIPNGQWTHVAAVKNGPKLSLYVNGKRARSVDVPATVLSAAKDFSLGANPHYSGDEYFDGHIDDFAFHGKAFTDRQIAALYDQSKP